MLFLLCRVASQQWAHMMKKVTYLGAGLSEERVVGANAACTKGFDHGVYEYLPVQVLHKTISDH